MLVRAGEMAANGTKHTKGVVDLTFQEIENDEQLLTLLRKALTDLLEGGGATGRALSPGRRRKLEEVTAIRLSNNLLTTMDSICGPMMAAVDTTKILWMDLSFNKIARVSADFAIKFPNVTTIYCHANQVAKLSEIKKFGLFKNLKSLSLYGCPVEDNKHYRNFVLYCCPGLTQFDSSPVTKSERKRAEVWAMTFRRKLVPNDD